MLRITLKGLLGHKRRLASTFVAVLSGVAFLAGTMMLSDTIGKTFDDLFGDVFAETDAIVRSENSVSGDFGEEFRGRISADLVDDVRAVDGVAFAEGFVQGYAQIVGADGEALGNPNMGAPTFGGDWAEFDELNPFTIVAGEPPTDDDDVVIDKKSADDGDLDVGDRAVVITKAGNIDVEVVGIAKFGSADSPGGASFAMFTQDAAEQYIGEPGQVDTVAVAAEEGVTQEELRDRIAAAMPDGIEVLTGEEITQETQDDIATALSFFTIFLGVFAGIALVVSVFSIYNTFSIIVAQRTREMALLRAVGASRRQVLTSVLGEAFVIGLVASLVGLAGGVVMVGVLKSMLTAFGVDLPAGGVVLRSDTIVTALLVGVLVTLVSAVAPAIKASRVAPLAALRDVAIDTAGRSRWRIGIGAVVIVLGLFATFSAIGGGGGSEGLFTAAGGVLLVLVGIIVLGPVLARPAGRVLGAPITRFRGVTGRLATENARRNPKRTANTAAALLIGVGVVGFFTVLATSVKESIDRVLGQTVTSSVVVDSGSFGVGGFSTDIVQQIREIPEVETAAGIAFTTAEVDGDSEFITAADPVEFPNVIDLGVAEGALADLGATGIAVHDTTAEDEGLTIGDSVTVNFPQTGEQQFTVTALYGRPELVGNWFISEEAYEANVPDRFVTQVFVDLADGVDPKDGIAAIETAVDAYPQADVQSSSAFADAQAESVNQILGLIYAMLGFAVIIALMGIGNTLSLSIYERTRELGLLRAVGMTRSQVRASVRWESVIIAVFGTALGLLAGVLFGWVTITAADEPFLSFSFPAFSLAVVVVLAALAGVLAALSPARRAARLNVLAAIATE